MTATGRGLVELTPDAALDEWVWLRGDVLFDDFAKRLGVPHKRWEKWYTRAAEKGDPRAVGRVREAGDGASAARRGIVRLPGVRAVR